jgi:hypothetical protein
MAEEKRPALRGTVPGGRARAAMALRQDYTYNGLGYDTLTESPGERVVRLNGQAQWQRKPPATEPPGSLEPRPDVPTSVAGRCESCGYLLDTPGHLNSGCA